MNPQRTVALPVYFDVPVVFDGEQSEILEQVGCSDRMAVECSVDACGVSIFCELHGIDGLDPKVHTMFDVYGKRHWAALPVAEFRRRLLAALKG